jgi:PhnB protein
MTSIAPWITVRDASASIAFYRAAFGASVDESLDAGAGTVFVAGLSVDGAGFWLSADPEFAGQGDAGGAVRMILTVADPDAVHASALAAGATEVGAVREEHGWRIGRIADPDGHHWEVGRRLVG